MDLEQFVAESNEALRVYKVNHARVRKHDPNIVRVSSVSYCPGFEVSKSPPNNAAINKMFAGTLMHEGYMQLVWIPGTVGWLSEVEVTSVEFGLAGKVDLLHVTNPTVADIKTGYTFPGKTMDPGHIRQVNAYRQLFFGDLDGVGMFIKEIKHTIEYVETGGVTKAGKPRTRPTVVWKDEVNLEVPRIELDLAARVAALKEVRLDWERGLVPSHHLDVCEWTCGKAKGGEYCRWRTCPLYRQFG